MKIDFHCHSYYSNDAISSPKELIENALKKGLDGIALTDHNTAKGWNEAITAAKELGALLVLGEEIKTERNGETVGDVLGLFLQKEIKSREPFEVMKEIKSQGGIVVIPHPFHFYEGFKDDLRKYVNLIDGMEVFNARMRFTFSGKKSMDFAKNHNLAMISSSDAHHKSSAGNAFTLADAENLEDFKKNILEKKTKIGGKKSPIYQLIFPMIGRFLKHA